MAFSKKNDSYIVLDLGSYSIKILVGSYDGASIKVKESFIVKTPEGSYYDGKVKDVDSIALAIKNALAERQVKEKNCIVSFNSKDVIQKELSVPELSYDDTVGLIRYEISQYLPINVEEYDIAYKNTVKGIDMNDNEESEELEDVNNIYVFSYIVKKSLVDDLHDLVLACGLEPIYLDFHSNAVSKFVKHIYPSDKKAELFDNQEEKTTIAFIDLGQKNVLIDIANGNDIVLSRVVDFGFVEQDKLVAKRFGVSLEEAQKIRQEKLCSNMLELYEIHSKIKEYNFQTDDIIDKTELGIGEGIVTSDEKELFMLLNECMIMYDEMAIEISKILQYYTKKTKISKIDKVLIHGLSTENKSLVEFFNAILDFKVETIDFNKIENINFIPSTKNKNAYLNTLGALIRYGEDK